MTSTHTLFDVAPYTFQIIPSYNNEWEDRIFFYFDTRSLHDDARVSFDAYVLLMSMPPAGMTSTLVLTAYSHGSSVMLPSDWYEATSGQSKSDWWFESDPAQPQRHINIDVTEAARASRSKGYLAVTMIDNNYGGWLRWKEPRALQQLVARVVSGRSRVRRGDRGSR